MKKIAILILGMSVFASLGCGRSKRVAEAEPEGAVISENGEVLALDVEESAPEKKKRKKLFGRKRDQKAELADSGEGGSRDSGAAAELEAGADRQDAKPKKKEKSDLDRAAEALSAAKVHIELEDFDFAGEELRKIQPGSPLYQEAQRLLEAYR